MSDGGDITEALVGPGRSVRFGEPLARHTPLRTGGSCDAWVVAHDVTGVAEVVAACRQAGWRLAMLGAGTRTIVRDGPINGVMMRLGTSFQSIDLSGDTWTVGAGVPMLALLSALAKAGRGGLESVVGVPGTVGASVLNDDGWGDVVDAVQVLRRGRPTDVTLEQATQRRGAIVLGVRLVVPEGDGATLRSAMQEALRGLRSPPPGSWYASTGGEPVRDVFRSVRLEQVRLRHVAIPEAAPEMLVNLGGGTAEDLALLSRSAFERVKKIRGDQLAPQMRWIGRAAT